jgi:ABC-2 type transport system permease protein
MRKVVAVALREYKAAVQTKAFLVSLLLMPVIVAISIAVQVLANRAEIGKTNTFAVIDRTGRLEAALTRAERHHNEVEVLDEVTKQRIAPAYDLLFVQPSAEDAEAMTAQRLEVSARHERGELEGILEIGPDVFDVSSEGVVDDRHRVRFQTDKLAATQFSQWASSVINAAIQAERFERASISPEIVTRLQTPVPLHVTATTKRDPKTGMVEEASEAARVASFFLPALLVMLMFMMVLLGAVPAMQGIVEEKQQRIAEVLLGSVPPFQLMLGKLLGVVGVSFTVASVYLGGGYAVAAYFSMTSLLAPGIVIWFVLYMVLAALMYGSLFMAVGAAASDMKETQSMQMPIMMVVTLPLLLLGSVLRDPDGPVAIAGSFVPLSAPMLMIARLSSPGGVAWWQPALAAVGVLATALACVWAAGRVFRVGLLMQGKGVKLADLARWIVRG